MSEPTQPTALVRVRQYGGTYLAGAKIGNAKQVNASCTAGEKTAAKRAAAKAFGCDEDHVDLSEVTTKGFISKNSCCFWATQRVAKPQREMIRIPVFTGEELARAVEERDERVTPPLVIDEETWDEWFGSNSKTLKP